MHLPACLGPLDLDLLASVWDVRAFGDDFEQVLLVDLEGHRNANLSPRLRRQTGKAHLAGIRALLSG